MAYHLVCLNALTYWRLLNCYNTISLYNYIFGKLYLILFLCVVLTEVKRLLRYQMNYQSIKL